MLQSMGPQRVRQDLETEQQLYIYIYIYIYTYDNPRIIIIKKEIGQAVHFSWCLTYSKYSKTVNSPFFPLMGRETNHSLTTSRYMRTSRFQNNLKNYPLLDLKKKKKT